MTDRQVTYGQDAQPVAIGWAGENHPVDRLARVREQIKELEATEKELKAAVLAMDEDDRVGRWYEASTRTTSTRRLNVKRLTEAYGEEAIDQFKDVSESTVGTVRAME
jgi:hypothetical protein